MLAASGRTELMTITSLARDGRRLADDVRGVYCEIHPWDMKDEDVRAFGAKGDSKNLDSVAINKAIRFLSITSKAFS